MSVESTISPKTYTRERVRSVPIEMLFGSGSSCAGVSSAGGVGVGVEVVVGGGVAIFVGTLVGVHMRVGVAVGWVVGAPVGVVVGAGVGVCPVPAWSTALERLPLPPDTSLPDIEEIGSTVPSKIDLIDE